MSLATSWTTRGVDTTVVVLLGLGLQAWLLVPDGVERPLELALRNKSVQCHLVNSVFTVITAWDTAGHLIDCGFGSTAANPIGGNGDLRHICPVTGLYQISRTNHRLGDSRLICQLVRTLGAENLGRDFRPYGAQLFGDILLITNGLQASNERLEATTVAQHIVWHVVLGR